MAESESVPSRGAGRRGQPQRLVAVLCAVVGTGLLAGTALTGWAERHAAGRVPSADAAYRKAGSLWRDAPVDALFPPVLAGPGAGPGGADRTWTRVAVAPDADCAAALAAEWQAAFAGTGCTRVLRASYTDATRSSLVAVGMVFTPGEASAMAGLQGRLGAPPGFGFADERRAAWTAAVLPEGPVVVYTVAAFADGRVLDAPVPADEAVRADASGAVAQSGLGHEAKAVGELVRAGLSSLAVPAGSAR
ncbi:hypothetical protein [Streptomyces sp. 2P-4]|uniref:hypothetical protein n=1 Tax=Streptomyces sp. 2P-4 TaxID=2931974 RepID=UPI00253FE5E1|nr:hypothetical protein [Streptomyces sp. 2P-4]